MVVKIKFTFEGVGEVVGEVSPDRSPKTYEALLKALPFESTASRWGEEVYFSTPVSVGEENAVEVVEFGTIAYWPPGNALCLFFGPTPVSRRPDEIRPYSPVNVLGKVIEGIETLKKVGGGTKVRVELIKD